MISGMVELEGGASFPIILPRCSSPSFRPLPSRPSELTPYTSSTTWLSGHIYVARNEALSAHTFLAIQVSPMASILYDIDSDCYSDTSDSVDSQYELESIYGDHAQSILSSLEKSIEIIDDFLAYDRGFLHGDIVCSSIDPSGQRGQIIDVEIMVDLDSSSGKSLKSVTSKNLIRFKSFVLGDYVVYGPWLGKVINVIDNVTVLFDDGLKCEIRVDDPLLQPVFSKMSEDMQYPFYPGQRISLKQSNMLSCGPWKATREGVVCHVGVESVYVSWITSVANNYTQTMPPPSLQNPKNLTVLSYCSYSNYQVGDWCFLSSDSEQHNQVLGVNKTSEDTSPQCMTAMLQCQNSIYDNLYVISKAKTEVDVLWQDGSVSLHLESQVLTPVNNVGENDFWPGQFVQQRRTSDYSNEFLFPHVGIVESADAKEKTVRVKWLSFNDCERHCDEEVVSAYELFEHPQYSYAIGDVVTKTNQLERDSEYSNRNTSLCFLSEEELVHDDFETYSDSYLSSIGLVIGLRDDRVHVKWASGFSSKVSPSEIVSVDRFDDQALASEVHSENIDVASGKEAEVSLSVCMKNDVEDPTELSLPQAAFKYLRGITASLFGFQSSILMQGFFKSTGSNDFTASNASTQCGKELTDIDETDMMKLSNLSLPINDDLEKMALDPQIDTDKVGHFNLFDMVFDLSDHHFADSISKQLVNRIWLKKVHEEWNILQKNLPDTIYVRVSEERMELMRAAIVGPRGTPYHDGLFFFDISFPPQFPNDPPLVHYHSCGLRLNPNLYESGKVCLSLLNTWKGSDMEVWNPESSTILQVLLSLQALVLNNKPYFNEAGYDRHVGGPEGEKNSTAYNENAFLLTCKSILYLLKRPPKHFEALVEGHFARCSHSFLLACKNYMNGASVGTLKSNQRTPDSQGSSTGFRIMLTKLFPLLVSAFSEKGIDCLEFI